MKWIPKRILLEISCIEIRGFSVMNRINVTVNIIGKIVRIIEIKE